MSLDNTAGTDQDDLSTGEEELSLRDQLSNAFEEHTGEELEGSTITPAEERAPRERDPVTGKFKPRVAASDAGEAPAAAPAVAGTPNAVKPAAAAAPAAADTGSTVQPPAAWSADAKAKWSNIPPDIQAVIAAREAEVHKGFTRLDEDRNLGKTMRDTLSPYMATINALGATPQQAVQSLLNADHILRNGAPQQKTELFRRLSQQFGVDLSSVVAGAPAPDATVTALQRQVQELTAYISTQQRDAQEYTQRTMLADIEAFRADKPHFETVRPMMAVLMQNGQATSLQDAYDQAFRAHPTTSQLWLDDQVKSRTQTSGDAARARVEKAKSAAVSVSGSPGANNSAAAAMSGDLREALTSQFREAGYRV